MKRVELKHIPLRPTRRFERARRTLPALTFGLFLLGFALVLARNWILIGVAPSARWPEGLFLALAVVSTLATMSRQLPGQNVLLSAVFLFLSILGFEILNGASGVPFGPLVYTEKLGRSFFNTVPWPIPFIWVVLVLNSRGVARLALRPWRTSPNYGLWVIGVTVALTLLTDAGLEPVASRVWNYWFWKPTRLPSDWYGTPWVNFLGRGVTLLLTLTFLTPLWLNKKPVPFPPDYYPLAVWSLLCLWLAAACASHGYWAASVAVAVALLAVMALAARGRKTLD